ncbi:GFA family protein [Sphingobium sp. DC-2]|uniref:GFA family protein n=1 Tax=Sphingobium sp. DC-2 TaxID=1303256 RepID=UPI0004C2B3CF|nr:GFA family protein [Sphingobium sp. DC-2]
MAAGRCQCGSISYDVEGDPVYSALCHCADCRRSAGAPMVGWALFPEDKLRVNGTPATYASSENVTRHFCGTCGSGLFYSNAVTFPGMVDIQTATLDDPSAFPPSVHVQWAEAAPWMAQAHGLPKFDRYPEG